MQFSLHNGRRGPGPTNRGSCRPSESTTKRQISKWQRRGTPAGKFGKMHSRQPISFFPGFARVASGDFSCVRLWALCCYIVTLSHFTVTIADSFWSTDFNSSIGSIIGKRDQGLQLEFWPAVLRYYLQWRGKLLRQPSSRCWWSCLWFRRFTIINIFSSQNFKIFGILYICAQPSSRCCWSCLWFRRFTIIDIFSSQNFKFSAYSTFALIPRRFCA